MSIRATVRGLAGVLLAAAALASISVGAVAAHTITVTPNGNADGFGPRSISKSWAQAHCNAESPSLIADSSKGVVQFLPAQALPCPAVPNPGGQIHPHADD